MTNGSQTVHSIHFDLHPHPLQFHLGCLVTAFKFESCEGNKRSEPVFSRSEGYADVEACLPGYTWPESVLTGCVHMISLIFD